MLGAALKAYASNSQSQRKKERERERERDFGGARHALRCALISEPPSAEGRLRSKRGILVRQPGTLIIASALSRSGWELASPSTGHEANYVAAMATAGHKPVTARGEASAPGRRPPGERMRSQAVGTLRGSQLAGGCP